MKIPLYVIEEFLIRLQEFNPETGTLETCARLGSQMIVKTNKGMITVPLLLLNLQLNNPVMLRKKDIELLASQFIKEEQKLNSQEKTIVEMQKEIGNGKIYIYF